MEKISAVSALAALAQDNRLDVFRLLVTAGPEGLPAGEIAETLSLVSGIGFSGAFSFKYSPRPGTPGADMSDQVAEETKSERLHRLQAEIGKPVVHAALSFFAPHDPGYVLDISGAAVLKSSKHQAAAQKFVALSPAQRGRRFWPRVTASNIRSVTTSPRIRSFRRSPSCNPTRSASLSCAHG